MIDLFPIVALFDAAMAALLLVLVVAILHNAAGRHVGRARAIAALLALLGALGKVGLCALDIALWVFRGTLFAVEPDQILGRATLTHGTTAMVLLSLCLMLRAGFRPSDTTLSGTRRDELLRGVRRPRRLLRGDENLPEDVA